MAHRSVFIQHDMDASSYREKQYSGSKHKNAGTRVRKEYDAHRVSSAALQAFFNLSKRWGLSTNEERTLLGSPAKSTFFKWKKDKSSTRPLNKDALERISYLLGIFKDLNILLPSERAADEWIKKPNSAFSFQGQSALDRMLGGSLVDLADVRRYLNSQRGI